MAYFIYHSKPTVDNINWLHSRRVNKSFLELRILTFWSNAWTLRSSFRIDCKKKYKSSGWWFFLICCKNKIITIYLQIILGETTFLHWHGDMTYDPLNDLWPLLPAAVHLFLGRHSGCTLQIVPCTAPHPDQETGWVAEGIGAPDDQHSYQPSASSLPPH